MFNSKLVIWIFFIVGAGTDIWHNDDHFCRLFFSDQVADHLDRIAAEPFGVVAADSVKKIKNRIFIFFGIISGENYIGDTFRSRCGGIVTDLTQAAVGHTAFFLVKPFWCIIIIIFFPRRKGCDRSRGRLRRWSDNGFWRSRGICRRSSSDSWS